MFPKPKNSRKIAKTEKFCNKIFKKLLKFTYFVDNTSKCIPEQIFYGKLQLFLTDGQKSRIHLVYLQKFSISQLEKKLLEFFGFTLCFRTFQAKIFFFEFFIQLTDSSNKQGEFVIFQSAIAEVF